MDIPGDQGASPEGKTLTFKIGGRTMATGVWHSGTNVRLDFHPPQAVPGGPYNGAAGAPINFAGSANDWGTDATTYDWDWDNNGTYDATGQNISHTWPDIGSYTIGLRVIDERGGMGTATTTVLTLPKHSISLVSGWNLVSFNLHPVDTSTATVLSSIAGHYDLVYAWDASTQAWLKYDPIMDPPSLNSLQGLDETMGFWIRMDSPQMLEVVGSVPVTTPIPLMANAAGWNLVGYPSAVNRPLPDVLRDHGVGIDYSIVYANHAADTADPWKLYERTGPAWVNDLTEFAPGWGYWVRATANNTWSVSYAAP
jgi:hypothetical protein